MTAMVHQLSPPAQRRSAALQLPDVPTAGKERILNEARDQFVARGYADVTMQEIADAVGLTKAAIYYHFGDKESLFEAVFEAEAARNADGIVAQMESTPSFSDQLERVAHFMLVTGGSSLGRLLTDLDRYVADSRRVALIDRMRHPFDVVRPIFERAANAGLLQPVDLDIVIPLYFSMIFGQILREAHGQPPTAAPRALAKSIAAMTIDGIGAKTAYSQMNEPLGGGATKP
jgi:AcrR family transcriptional regulator